MQERLDSEQHPYTPNTPSGGGGVLSGFKIHFDPSLTPYTPNHPRGVVRGVHKVCSAQVCSLSAHCTVQPSGYATPLKTSEM